MKYLLKNALWLTLPPLLFSFAFMNLLPVYLSPKVFNTNISDTLLYAETILRIVVFAMPGFFSIGLVTKSQKYGMSLYLTGLVFYFLSYAMLIIFPDTVWSKSMLGVAATAYTNVCWLVGLGLMGDKFYFAKKLQYNAIFYVAPVIIFISLHTAHAIIVYQKHF